MSKGKGYLLPDVPYTEDYDCMIVVYPDRDEYRQALVASILHLGTWVAWERDDNKGGKVAAELWQKAFEETVNMATCFDSIGVGLQAIEDSIRASGGGSACCDSPTTIVYGVPPDWQNGPDGVTDPNNPISDPPDWENQEPYQEYKCKAANAIVADLDQTLANLSTMSGLLAAMGLAAFYAIVNTSLLSGLIVGLMAVGMSASAAIVTLIAGFAAMAVGGTAVLALFNVIRGNFDYQQVVCDLYASTTSGEAQQLLLAHVYQAIDSLPATPEKVVFSDQMGNILSVLLHLDLFNVLFSYDADVAARASVYSCASCLFCSNEHFFFDSGTDGLYFIVNQGTPGNLSGTFDPANGHISNGSLRISHLATGESLQGSWNWNLNNCIVTPTSEVSGWIRSNSSATTVRVMALIDGVWRYAGADNPASGTWFKYTIDLSPYVGQTVTQVRFWAVKGTGYAGTGYWLFDELRIVF